MLGAEIDEVDTPVDEVDAPVVDEVDRPVVDEVDTPVDEVDTPIARAVDRRLERFQRGEARSIQLICTTAYW
jgi:hypothetical protein